MNATASAPSGTGPIPWQVTRSLIDADLRRATGRSCTRTLAAELVRSPNTRFLVVFRLGAWASSSPRRRLVQAMCSLLHRRWGPRYGLTIPFATQIGPGLLINHRIGGIMITRRARLGSGVTLMPGVVIGKVHGRNGSPVIGDDVTLCVGAKVIGAVVLGDRVVVGANAVVTRDLPAGTTAAGVPARVISRAPGDSERDGPVSPDAT